MNLGQARHLVGSTVTYQHPGHPPRPAHLTHVYAYGVRLVLNGRPLVTQPRYISPATRRTSMTSPAALNRYALQILDADPALILAGQHIAPDEAATAHLTDEQVAEAITARLTGTEAPVGLLEAAA